MEDNNRQAIKDLISRFSDLDYIRPENIPNIDLYMDQVTTFLETQLAQTKRNEDEKILTKTMINNYTKNHVLPSPDKKKYSQNHVLTLILIYYLKNFLSIKDIQSLIAPIIDCYFDEDSEYTFMDIYEELVRLISTKQARELMKDVLSKYNDAQNSFENAPEEDREFLQNFAFICMLCFDVYVKKMMIEQLIDMSASEEESSSDKKKKASEN